ncbi:squalene/phytoene synthase family protein [Streptomyces sp. M10(2022)]
MTGPELDRELNRELDAAGVRDPLLRQAYTSCAALLRHKNHGTHSWMRTQLPRTGAPTGTPSSPSAGSPTTSPTPPNAPSPNAPSTTTGSSGTSSTSSTRPRTTPRPSPTPSPAPASREDLVCRAFCDLVQTWQIPEPGIHQAADALRTDMNVRTYETLAALEHYMDGVSGQPARWLTRLLAPPGEPPCADAERASVAWGFGLQTLDIVLDIVEDLRLGKIYIPSTTCASARCTRRVRTAGPTTHTHPGAASTHPHPTRPLPRVLHPRRALDRARTTGGMGARSQLRPRGKADHRTLRATRLRPLPLDRSVCVTRTWPPVRPGSAPLPEGSL